MPRRKKQTDIEDSIEEAKAPKPGGNGFDGAKTKSFVQRIDNLHRQIDSEKSEFMLRCKDIHADINEVYQEAKDEAGIPKKALKKVIKARVLERKAAEVREDLEGEDQDNFDLIRQALGELADTPLGGAVAVNQNGERKTMAEAMREPGAPLGPSTTDRPFGAPPDDEPRTAP